MKKTELISTVAEKCEVKKQDAEKIINADHENSFLLAEHLGQAAKRNTEFIFT